MNASRARRRYLRLARYTQRIRRFENGRFGEYVVADPPAWERALTRLDQHNCANAWGTDRSLWKLRLPWTPVSPYPR